jgi:hypothetical protein
LPLGKTLRDEDLHPPVPVLNEWTKKGTGMRIVGHDIHRGFAEAVARENGKLKRLGRIDIAYVKQVEIANPKQVRIIAHAKIKTDTIDVEVFELRRQLGRLRAHLVASQRRLSAPRPACAP